MAKHVEFIFFIKNPIKSCKFALESRYILSMRANRVDYLIDPPYLPLQTGNKVWDDFMCRVWYSSVILWTCFMASTYNLVLVALDRFFAVVFPILYRNTNTMHGLVSAGVQKAMANGYSHWWVITLVASVVTFQRAWTGLYRLRYHHFVKYPENHARGIGE